MNDAFPNEVEERRVIRLLADAADDITPLSGQEVDELMHAAIGGATGGRPRLVRRRPVARRLQHVLAAGAAAAVVVSGSLALTSSPPQATSSRLMATRTGWSTTSRRRCFATISADPKW